MKGDTTKGDTTVVSPATRSKKHRFTLRRMMGILHLWLGIGLSIYLALVCVTGTILVYEGPIARALNPRIFAVETGPRRATLDAVRASVGERFPQATTAELAEFRTFSEWNGLHRFFIESKGQYVYVDPFTARIRGIESSSGSFLGQTNSLHVSLTLGFIGYLLNGIGGILACLLLASGMWLWWPATKNVGRAMASRLWIRRGVGFKKALLDWHNVVGFWSLGLLFVICLTGSALIFGAQVRGILQTVSSEPIDPARPKVAPETLRGPMLSLDRLVEIARTGTGGATELYHLQLPLEKSAPAEITLYYPVGLGVNEWATVWVHPTTGRVLGAYDSPRQNRLQRMIGPLTWGLHVGNWGGETVKLLYGILGIVPVWLSFTGIWFWLRKMARKRARR